MSIPKQSHLTGIETFTRPGADPGIFKGERGGGVLHVHVHVLENVLPRPTGIGVLHRTR